MLSQYIPYQYCKRLIECDAYTYFEHVAPFYNSYTETINLVNHSNLYTINVLKAALLEQGF